MAMHLYKVGQAVRPRQPLPDLSRGVTFRVLRQMPAAVDGELLYRVRGSDYVERMVGEGQIAPVEAS